MKVQDIMTRDVKSCGPDTNLAAATEILWRTDNLFHTERRVRVTLRLGPRTAQATMGLAF